MPWDIRLKTIEGEHAGREVECGKQSCNIPRRGEPYRFPAKGGEDIVTTTVREVHEKKQGRVWIFKDEKSSHVLEAKEK